MLINVSVNHRGYKVKSFNQPLKLKSSRFVQKVSGRWIPVCFIKYPKCVHMCVDLSLGFLFCYLYANLNSHSDQIRSVAQLCPTLCDPMSHSTPGLPIHHQLPEFIQTHVHRVSDAIQPSHPLSSPSPLCYLPNYKLYNKMCVALVISAEKKKFSFQ